MKEASKPFAWWFVEAFLGSQCKPVEPKPPLEPLMPEGEECRQPSLPEKEETWAMDISG